jgi:hypothetical protein
VILATLAHDTRALLTRPWDMFEAPSCFPMENALTTGDPMITQGIMGIPAYLLTGGDPVAAFNFSTAVLIWLNALGMYLLVRRWTGIPAAGIAAGVAFAYSPVNVMVSTVHSYSIDQSWTLFAFLFAERLFKKGRMRDAVALAVCCWLQMAQSLYTMLTAVTLALPVGTWLLAQNRQNLRPGPIFTAIALILLFSVVIYSPYLSALGGESTEEKIWFTWEWMRGFYIASLPLVLLAGFAMFMPKRLAAGEDGNDPRIPMAVAVVISIVPASVPAVYFALAQVVPGLEVIRSGPINFASVPRVAIPVLAGVGIAALIRATPKRWSAFTAAALIGFLSIDAVRPESLGYDEPMSPMNGYRVEPFRVRPAADVLEFFEQLESKGNRGPLLEIPIDRDNILYQVGNAPKRMGLTAYHERPTSVCAMSFWPPIMEEVSEVAKQLPTKDAVDHARRLGFTTILVHRLGHGIHGLNGPDWKQFHEQATAPGSGLRKLRKSRRMMAFEILPAGDTARPQ